MARFLGSTFFLHHFFRGSKSTSDEMLKKTNERLEELKIVHETVEMMIRLIKDLGFEPPPKPAHDQTANKAKTATLYGEKLSDIYLGYATMLDDKEKLKTKIDTLTAQDAETICATENVSLPKEQSSPHQKIARIHRAKRRGNPWDRPRKRQRQPRVKSQPISKSPLSKEVIYNIDTV